MSRESGQEGFVFDVERGVVMGHEFSARVLEPGTSGLRRGDAIVAQPVMPTARKVHVVGYSNEFPGGFGERMLLRGELCLRIPEGLDPRHAALTEPLAVGLHAVASSGIATGEPAVVLGCGPVGLTTIAWLAEQGVEPIVAADFSSARRRLALRMGAHAAVDPREEPAVDAWRRVDPRHDAPGRGLVLYEAVGVPGMIDQAMRAAPRRAQILVVGLCMQPDRFHPTIGVNKELAIRFVLGWTPDEFRQSLRALADGKLEVEPLVTGEVGLGGVAAAFLALRDPEAHAKILVRPSLEEGSLRV
jgi:threonine dehydrogenase-like Zn-dependent dehydrogenase